MSEPLYQIQEEGTDGWYLLENHQNLTKEKCSEVWKSLISEGYNPNRLKIVRTS